MEKVNHRVVREQHCGQQGETDILSIEAVVVSVEDPLVQVKEAKKVFPRNRRQKGDRIELIGRPHHDDHVEGDRTIGKELVHYGFDADQGQNDCCQ